MEKTNNFGELAAENIKIGDIVAWSKWDSGDLDWQQHLGVVIEVKNTIFSNRMVCISVVLPMKEPRIPLELFTFSLKLVSSAEEKVV
tara:strand:+ start:7546 stop:7806 length:261 start_codon:yes stop_codon:yes gene_type:complete